MDHFAVLGTVDFLHLDEEIGGCPVLQIWAGYHSASCQWTCHDHASDLRGVHVLLLRYGHMLVDDVPDPMNFFLVLLPHFPDWGHDWLQRGENERD